MGKDSLASKGKGRFVLSAVIVFAILAALACNASQQQPETETPSPTLTSTDELAAATVEVDPAEAYAAALEMTGTAIQQTLIAMSGQGQAAAPTQPPAAATYPPISTPGESEAADEPTPPGQLIDSFTAAPEVINPDDDIVLTWSATGDSAELCYPYPNGGPVCSSVTLVGTETFNFGDVLRGVPSIEFTLTVRSGAESEQAAVLVMVGCPDVWFFEPAPESCPASAGVSTSAAVQHFERGFMIWLDQLDLIYVFHQDPATDKVIDSYFTFVDPWQPGLPEDDQTITPPDGFYQPKRGFGMVWRGEIADETHDDQVRGLLGWAIELEFAYEAYFQGDTVGHYPSAYILGPDGEIIAVGASLSIITPTAIHIP